MHHLPLLRVSVRNTDERIHHPSPALRAMVPGVAFYPGDLGDVWWSQTIPPPAVKTPRSVSSRWTLCAQPGFASFGRFSPAAAPASTSSCSSDLPCAGPCKARSSRSPAPGSRPTPPSAAPHWPLLQRPLSAAPFWAISADRGHKNGVGKPPSSAFPSMFLVRQIPDGSHFEGSQTVRLKAQKADLRSRRMSQIFG